MVNTSARTWISEAFLEYDEPVGQLTNKRGEPSFLTKMGIPTTGLHDGEPRAIVTGEEVSRRTGRDFKLLISPLAAVKAGKSYVLDVLVEAGYASPPAGKE